MRCASCPFRTKAIGNKGPVDSPFVIVGESPGSRELATGKPFMGPSGQLLNTVLREAGLPSGVEPFVTNAISCYPADKDMAKLNSGAKACQGRLHQELGAYPRKVILALGNAAMWSTTDDYSLKSTKDRGRIIASPYGPIVLAYHPAYLLRNGSGLSVWRKDVKQAVDILRGIKPGEWSEPTHRVIESPSEYNIMTDEYLHAASQGELLTGDVETDQFHWYGGRILCHGVTKGDGSHVDVIPEKLIYGMKGTTKRLLEGGRWNWHNGLFDIKWFRAMGIEAHVDEDDMLLSYALNENSGYHDLDQVAQHWIKAPKHKHMLDAYRPNKKASFREIPPLVLYRYNAIDLSKTHASWFPLRDAVREDPHLESLYTRLLIPAVDFIAEMQLYGVLLDQDKVRANQAALTAQIESVNAQLQVYAQKHIGREINFGSPKQLKELLYGKLGFGQMSMSTNEAALEDIARKYEHPIVDLLLKYRELIKARGTYVTNLLDSPLKSGKGIKPGHMRANGRIHADYKLHGTTTGRLAGAEPNMLNQPRGEMIRSQFIASPGKIFCEVDLNQAELRSLALMSGDPVLVKIYTENITSIHDVTTGAFYAPKEEVMKGEAAYERVRQMLHLDVGSEPSFVYGQAKMRGKAVNFGIVYGREAFSLAKEFNIPIAEAQRWIDAWFDTYSEAARFIEWCRMAPIRKKTLTTVFGRKKRFGVVSNENLRNLQNESANFPHQSTASDIMLETAIEVHRPLRERWDAHIFNELYDAIYFEVDADDVKLGEIVPYVQGVITRIPRDRGLTRVPFLGDAKIGYNWGKMHDYNPSKDKIIELLGERQ